MFYPKSILPYVAAFALALLSTPAGAIVLIDWNNGADAGLTPGTPNIAEGIADGSGVWAKGPGVGFNGWGSGSAIVGVSGADSATLDSNDYLEFTVTPDTDYSLNLDTLSFNTRLQGSTGSMAIRSSLDGFTEDLFNGAITTGTDIVIDLDAEGGFDNITSALTFRAYVWNTETSGREIGFRNPTPGLEGTAIVPEPSTYAALAGIAMLAFVALRRRQR